MGNTYVKAKHDIAVTNTDGSLVGMMLAQNKDGTPAYSVYDDEYLAQQVTMGEPGYANLPPEKELAIRQDSWIAGMGQEVYDPSDPFRYFSSQGMDLRFKGMAIAGQAPQVVEYKGWVVPTGCLKPAGGWWDEANAYDINIASRAISNMPEATWGEWLYLTHSEINVSKIRYWLTQIAWNCDQINIGAYYDSAWNVIQASATPTTNIWKEVALPSTKAVTNVRVKLWRTASTQNVYLTEFELYSTDNLGNIGTVNAFATFNTQLYAVANANFNRLNEDGDGLYKVFTFGVAPTSLEPFTDDRLYIPLGFANNYYQMNVGEFFAENDLTNCRYQFMKTIHTTSPTMYANEGVYNIRSTTNPAVNSQGGLHWSIPPTNVGSPYYDITALVHRSGELFIMKEDIPYYLDSSGNVQSNVAPELASALATTSGKNSIVWQNKLYIPAGDQILLEVDGSTLTYRNPSKYCTNLSQYSGKVMALASDEEYLFMALEDGSNVQILAARLEDIAGSTPWVVHPIAEIVLAGVETMFVSTVFKKRLWIASTSASDSLYYIPLYTKYGDPTEDTNRAFLSNVSMETPWLHGNFRDTEKAFPELALKMGHIHDADVFFQAQYKTLGNSIYTPIANYVGSATSMKQTNYLPDAGTGHPVDDYIRLKFIANTDNTSLTPMLLSYKLKGILYPPRRKIIDCIARAVDEMVLADGTIEKNMATKIATTLDQAREATWPVSIRDIDGNTKTVKFLAANPFYTIIKKEKKRTKEKHYRLLMQEVQLS